MARVQGTIRHNRVMRYSIRTLLLFLSLLVAAGAFPACTNNPYRPSEAGQNIHYDTFHEEPKHLDPARAYASDEYEFMQ